MSVTKFTILIQTDDGKPWAIECKDADLSVTNEMPKPYEELEPRSIAEWLNRPTKTLRFTSHDFVMVGPNYTIAEFAAICGLTEESTRKYLETKDPTVLVREAVPA